MTIVLVSLIIASIFFAWLHFDKLAMLTFGSLLVVGGIAGVFDYAAYVPIVLLGALVYRNEQGISNKYLNYAEMTLMILLTVTLSLHKFPGFHNILIFDQISFSSNSTPFSMYINFDKPLFAIFYLIVFAPSISLQSSFKNLCLTLAKTLIPLLLFIIPLGLLTGHINIDFKFPNEFWIWATNNLLITCVAEEVFFRGFLQKRLSDWLSHKQNGALISLLLSSFIFGLAHIGGGWPFVGLATFAGIFYGLAFNLTKSVEAPILCHFGLNLAHFIGFTYPAAI